MNVITLFEQCSDDYTYSYSEVLVHFDDIPEKQDLIDYFEKMHIHIDEIGIEQLINNMGDEVKYMDDYRERIFRLDVVEVTKINKKK